MKFKNVLSVFTHCLTVFMAILLFLHQNADCSDNSPTTVTISGVLIHLQQLLTSCLNVKKMGHSNRRLLAQDGQFPVITTPFCWSILG
jgi:hypothetical protein